VFFKVRGRGRVDHFYFGTEREVTLSRIVRNRAFTNASRRPWPSTKGAQEQCASTRRLRAKGQIKLIYQ
jgi:hypothetical protein